MDLVLIIAIMAGIMAAAYPISHTFEHLEGNSPPPDVQEENSRKENWSLLLLVISLGVAGTILFAMMPN